ncbi:hypothetical protein GCM10007874_32190 [Labrys miyagiensis]|uniref:Uncharacterized protein n=1 Tax=Labrys miyagiensis TaxID=346912 RepID=A0ABQ6CPR6_9HYPH|nr:hypothetical protein GCM10007874_32190 [Labrys miyagiensis]
MRGWYSLALGYGLPANSEVAEGIEILHEIHASHFTRYPAGQKLVAVDLSSITNDVVDWLIAEVSLLVHRR